MKLRFATLFALVLSIAAAASAQTAKSPAQPAKLPPASEILNNYVKAIGGREAREKIKSMAMKGTVEMSPMGIKGTFETVAAEPNLIVTRINMTGLGEFLEGFDGTTAWAINPIQGARVKTAAEVAQQKLLSDFHRDTNLEKLYKSLTVTGIEKVGGSDAYVVKAEADALAGPTLMYFDAKTGLLVRSDSTLVAPEGKQPAKMFYEDYRTVDGVLVPFRVRTLLSAFEMTLTADDAKVNIPIKPEMFANPAK
jgi:outer membrane lipoprotein-sorting protein